MVRTKKIMLNILELSNIAEKWTSLRIPKLRNNFKLSMKFQNIAIQILLSTYNH